VASSLPCPALSPRNRTRSLPSPECASISRGSQPGHLARTLARSGHPVQSLTRGSPRVFRKTGGFIGYFVSLMMWPSTCPWCEATDVSMVLAPHTRSTYMGIRSFFAAASIVMMGALTLAQSITYDFDRAADFSRFKTFAWVRGTVLNDELNHSRIV